MKLTVATTFILLFSVTCSADEYYEFFSIKCAPYVSFVSIDPAGIWNIHEIVWPEGVGDLAHRKAWIESGWELHESNLKELENKFGLYIFGKPYGRYDSNPIICNTAKFNLTISSEPIIRSYVDDDVKVRYRGPMKVKIEIPRYKVTYEKVINDESSLHFDGDELELCEVEYPIMRKTKRQCTRYFSSDLNREKTGP